MALTRREPSSSAYQMVASPEGAALYAHAKKVAEDFFVLRPVGSDTPQSLRDRIGLLYVEEFLPTWQGLITYAAVANDPNFPVVVSTLSPLSRPKTESERSKNYMLYALVGAGLIALFFLYRRSRKTGTISAGAGETQIIPLGEVGGRYKAVTANRRRRQRRS